MKKNITLFTLILITVSFMSFQQKPKFDLKASVTRGQEVYTSYCVSCHQEKGEGIEDVYPPLAKSDYLTTDKKKLIQMVLHGATGEMKVNGKIYNGEMTGFDLTDQEVSDVLNYVKNSFGNKGDAVKPEEVKAVR
jgi:mono/diheme cytochrome c family protein